MKVIVAGSRGFGDFDLMVEKLDRLLQNQTDVVIVSGAARGADRLGEQYAELRGYDVHRYPADWKTHKRSAGYKRNVQMAENADALVAFWDGKSRGTQHMINIASDKGLKVRVVRT